jgi:hypothetical protein
MPRNKVKPCDLLDRYDGPSLAELDGWDRQRIELALTALGEAPKYLHPLTSDEDVAEWFNPIVSEDLVENPPPTPSQIAEWRKEYAEHEVSCLRAQLAAAYRRVWVLTLTVAQGWAIVEDVRGSKVAVSEKRYTSEEMLQAEVSQLLYEREIKRHARTQK